jgi:hypothetical protein
MPSTRRQAKTKAVHLCNYLFILKKERWCIFFAHNGKKTSKERKKKNN